MNPLEILLKYLGPCSYIGCRNQSTHIMRNDIHARIFCDAHPSIKRSYKDKSFEEVRLQDLADEIEEAVALGLENIVEEEPKKQYEIHNMEYQVPKELPRYKLPEPYFSKDGRYTGEIEVSYRKDGNPFLGPHLYDKDCPF